MHSCVLQLVYLFTIIMLASGGCPPANITYGYSMCYEDSKHCIKCYQKTSTKQLTIFSQDEYRITLMDQLNRARSRYAIHQNISNMKFTNWIKEFEAMTAALAADRSTEINCTDANYKIIDFTADIELAHPSRLDTVLREQLTASTKRMLNSTEMYGFNLNEFACCFTYELHGVNVATLLRCMVYHENRRNTSMKISYQRCGDCDHTSERCSELDWYQGLCVRHGFNETKLRMMIEQQKTQQPENRPNRILGPLLISSLVILVCILISYFVYSFVIHKGRTKHEMLVCDEIGRTSVIENMYTR